MRFPLQNFLLATALAASGAVSAQTNSVNVVTPPDGSVIAVPGFPATVPVTVEYSFYNDGNGNCVNPSVNDLTVQATQLPNGTPTTIYGPADPNAQGCPATVSFDWSVPAAGNYSLLLTGVRASGNGDDTQTDQIAVSFELDTIVSVEYPAPPAIANAYINSSDTLKKLQAKRRGCIISKIATAHGQDERYGAKPGPYNDGLVKSDVDSLLGC